MKMYPVVTILLAASLFLPPPSATAGLSDPEDLELIRTLIAHNLAAYEKIKSFRIEMEWSGVDNFDYPDQPNSSIPGGRRIEKAQGTYVRRGDWFRCDYTYLTTCPDRGGRVVENRTQFILCDQFTAMARTPKINYVRKFDLDSIASMPDSEKQIALGTIPYNPMSFGFDVGEHSIGRHLDYHPDVVTWTVEEQGAPGGMLYTVKKSNPHKGTVTYVFDAAKDYFITRQLYLNLKGETLIDVQVVPKQYDGVWIAERVDELNPLNNYEYHLIARSIEINCAIPDSEFDFESLEYVKEKASLDYFARGAKMVTLIYRDGEWIPWELDPELQTKSALKPEPRATGKIPDSKGETR